MVLAALLKDNKRLLCQFGAGKGKSRVAAALALYFLSDTKKQIYLVYPDEGLMRRDKEQCEHLWTYAGYVHQKGMGRLHHQVGIKGIPKTRDTIIIVDESDEVIMRDPVEFATSTMGGKLQVVCLTATPDDGILDGCERNLMKLMGYRLIKTEEK